MSFIEINIGEDIKEKECAPEGVYDLVVTGAELKEKEYDDGVKGNYINVLMAIEGTDEPYKMFNHILSIPNAGDDDQKTYNKKLSIKKFLATALPGSDISTGFNVEDLMGARFSCALGVEVDESGEYPDKNRLRLPKLDD